MKINEQDLQRAAGEIGLSPSQAEALWQQLKTGSEVEAHFEAAQVGYYFGAVLVIGAMGWFMTNGWDSFPGWQLSAIAIGYASVFFLAGNSFGPSPSFGFPPVCWLPWVFA